MSDLGLGVKRGCRVEGQGKEVLGLGLGMEGHVFGHNGTCRDRRDVGMGGIVGDYVGFVWARLVELLGVQGQCVRHRRLLI